MKIKDYFGLKINTTGSDLDADFYNDDIDWEKKIEVESKISTFKQNAVESYGDINPLKRWMLDGDMEKIESLKERMLDDIDDDNLPRSFSEVWQSVNGNVIGSYCMTRNDRDTWGDNSDSDENNANFGFAFNSFTGI